MRKVPALCRGVFVAIALLLCIEQPLAQGAVCPCDFRPGPFKVWVMLDTQTVAVIDCRTGQILGFVPMGGPCNSIVAKADCSVVFVGTTGNPTANPPKPPGFCDIDCRTLQVTERALPARPIPNGIICKGDQVWIAMENGVVAVFNCVTGAMQFVQVGGGCNTILAKCNGNSVFVGTAGDPAAGIAPGFCDIDCQTLVVTPRPLPVPPVANGMWLTPDDRKLWIMLSDFSVCVFDCLTGQIVAKIPVGGACNSIVGKCNGATVFLGNVGGDVPQQFFPPVGFNPSSPPTGNFTVDSFFDIAFQVELDLGQGPMPVAGSGEMLVQRTDPQGTLGNREIPIEIVAMNLQGISPIGPVIVENLGPAPGRVLGAPDPLTDFPVQAVDSFFDITYRITIPEAPGGPVVYETPPGANVRLELDPDGPPLTRIPFACDWWRTPPGVQVPIIQITTNPAFPPTGVVRCDRICFPPPPPPKPPGVCDIDCATLQIIRDCPLPFRPIPCGVTIRPGDQEIWVAMANGTVGAWDCDWNLLKPIIDVGGGCQTIDWKPDASVLFVGTAGSPTKPPGICDIDPVTCAVSENQMPGVPLPKGLLVCSIPCPGDIDGDGDVDLGDLAGVLAAFGTTAGSPGYNPNADIDGDGDVDLGDLSGLLGFFGTIC